MRKIVYMLAVFQLVACSNPIDCFKSSGEITTQTVTVESFERIVVNKDIELIITQGDLHKVEVKTGKNLLDDVEVKVNNGQLQLTEYNDCNSVSDYNMTKVYVTVPNLTEIRNSSQFTVSSQGVLDFPKLTLYAEDFYSKESLNVGDFKLTLNSGSVNVISNNISTFYLSGNVVELMIKFASGIGRFEGENLRAKNVNVFHRGDNDIVINPLEKLKAKIVATGNLIAVHKPKIIEVEEIYKGKLIFK